MKLSQRIATNTFALAVTHVICRIISFVLVLAIARHYATEKFGHYTFALSFIELFMVLADLGISKIMVRNVARDPEQSGQLLGALGVLKLLYSLVTFGLIYVFLRILHYSNDIIILTLVFGLRSLFDSFTGLLASLFKGHQRMAVLSPIGIGGILLAVGLGFFALKLDLDIIMIALAFMISSLIQFLCASVIAYVKFTKPVFNFKVKDLLTYAKSAAPFGLGSVFVRIFTRIDTVMLSKLTTMTIVGYYNASYNLIIVLLFLPGTFNEAIYPIMSKFFKTSDRDFQRTFERSFKYSMLIGIPMATGIFALADQFVLLFYGPRYDMSITALKILAWLIASSFGTFVFTTTLNSANREKLVTISVFFCSLFNITLNLIVIPKWQHIGASIATLFTELLFFSLSLIFVNKYVFKTSVLKHFVKPVLASASMYYVISITKTFMLVFPIFLGIITYLGVLLILRTLDETDKELLKKLITRKNIDN